MSRTHVTVNGIILTAEQVQQAVKELEMPETPKFKAGDIVEYGDLMKYLVVGGFLESYITKGCGMPTRNTTVRVTDGRSTYQFAPENLTRIIALADV